MVDMNPNNLSGEWKSQYFYHDNKDASEHVLDVQISDGRIVGESRPQADGSKIHLVLENDGKNHALTGTWTETTSPSGRYAGKTFHGAVQFLLNQAGAEAEGVWVGFNGDRTHLNTGRWALYKV